jgi:hypothetical protein
MSSLMVASAPEEVIDSYLPYWNHQHSQLKYMSRYKFPSDSISAPAMADFHVSVG